MCDTPAQTTTESTPPSLADIVREETDNGRIIVRFLTNMVLGKMEGATYSHQLEATRQLRALGLEIPQVAVKAGPKPARPRTQSTASTPAAPTSKISELVEIIREETDNGKDIVRFLVDVVQGNHEGFKPHHRLRAAIELRRCLTDICDHTGAEEEWEDVVDVIEDDSTQAPEHRIRREKRLNDEDDPFDFDNYDDAEYQKDRCGTRALRHIYGGKEAEEFAYGVAEKHRRKVLSEGPEPDRDMTPIENPEEDPYCKGHFGYRALRISYGNNETVRFTTKAVAEYYKHKFRHLINEDGSLAAGDETASLDPNVLQYLERSRHLLTADDVQPHEGPDPPSSATPGPDEDPPAPTPPPRKRRQLVHVGPPGEDPPDDDSRHYRDPDETRIPLRNSLRIPAGPL